MEINQEKIVDFDRYCDHCKFRDLPETEDPCFDCLREPVNTFTHMPTEFKLKKGIVFGADLQSGGNST